jgi:hypothetical protein
VTESVVLPPRRERHDQLPAGDHRIDALARPPCSECGKRTDLVGIEPKKPGFDLNTFECRSCGHYETSVTKVGALL